MFIDYSAMLQEDGIITRELAKFASLTYDYDLQVACIGFEGDFADIFLNIDKDDYNNLFNEIRNALRTAKIFVIHGTTMQDFEIDDDFEAADAAKDWWGSPQAYSYEIIP